VSPDGGRASEPPRGSGGLDWLSLVRRYVWHEERTPYLVRAERLTPRQARSELFAYGLLLAILAAIVAVVSALGRAPDGVLAVPGITLYAVALALGAVVLGAHGHPVAAWLCITAPLALELGVLGGVVRPGASTNERITLLTLGALWLGYGIRVVRIAHRLHRPA
jgi:hypothetical protein